MESCPLFLQVASSIASEQTGQMTAYFGFLELDLGKQKEYWIDWLIYKQQGEITESEPDPCAAISCNNCKHRLE